MRVMRPANRILRLLCLLCLGATCACNPKPNPGTQPVTATPRTFSYLALGNSYTIGEGVPAEQRWPVQLAKLLGEARLQRRCATASWRAAAGRPAS